MTRHPELPERDRRILARWSRPTSSTASRFPRCGWPAAASGSRPRRLRNVMARLEEQGYVRQPHTSAGRVPTDLGYRCYVDQLLAERQAVALAPDVEARLRRAGTVEDVLSHVSQEISRASHQVGFAMAPATEGGASSISTSCRSTAASVLVVLVADGGHVSHKVIEPPEEYRPRRAAAGGQLSQRRVQGAFARARSARRCSSGCTRSGRLYDQLMARALRLASTTFDGLRARSPSIYIQGTALLFDVATGDDPETTLATMRSLRADDRGEVAARAADRRLHGRQRPDGRHRLRTPGAGPAARSAS